MNVHPLATNLCERVMMQINKTERIERQNVGQVTPEMRDLKNELIEIKEIAQQIIEKIEESVEMNLEERRMLEKNNKGANRKNRGVGAGNRTPKR